MIHNLPQSLIEAATKILEPTPKLNWAVGGHKDKAEAAYRQKGMKILLVDANELIEKTHPDLRVSPTDRENHIGKRMERAVYHFTTGKFMDPPEISHDIGKYPISFGNGRHRTAASIIAGNPIIPVVVHPDDESKIRNNIKIHWEIENA